MKNKTIIHLLLFVIIMLISTFVLNRIYNTSDIPAHNSFCISFLTGENSIPDNFLYYLLLSVSAIFNPANVKIASLILLPAFIYFKFYVSYLYIAENEKVEAKLKYALLAFMLIFASSIYVPNLVFHRMYLGSFPPNVWHNSTTIAVMPFSIILFSQTIKQIKNFSWKRLLIISLLILINLSIKPSFLFVYVGALPLSFLLYKGFKKEFLLQMIPVAICLALIYLQTNLIFTPEKNAGIAIKPFFVYAAFHSSLSTPVLIVFFFSSAISSILFPLLVLVKKKISLTNLDFTFALIAFFGSLMISILFVETGRRWDHGNFFWQNIISAFILFLVSIKHSLPELITSTNLKRPNIFQITLFLHFVFGVVYILRIILFQTYV